MSTLRHNRRDFLQSVACAAAITALPSNSSSPLPWPKLAGSPVLDSLHPVIERSRDVHIHIEKIKEVAAWMAYEELPMPEYEIHSASARVLPKTSSTSSSPPTAWTPHSPISPPT